MHALTELQRLEAEAIHIMREVVAESERPVIEREGLLLMVEDDRMRLPPGQSPVLRQVRFRTLGCYPLSCAVPSTANTVAAIIDELRVGRHSERQRRLIDPDATASIERKKQAGYF